MEQTIIFYGTSSTSLHVLEYSTKAMTNLWEKQFVKRHQQEQLNLTFILKNFEKCYDDVKRLKQNIAPVIV